MAGDGTVTADFATGRVQPATHISKQKAMTGNFITVGNG